MNVLPLMPTICKTAHIVAARLPRHVRLSGVMDDLIQVGVLEALSFEGRHLPTQRLHGAMLDWLRQQGQSCRHDSRKRSPRGYRPRRPTPALNRQQHCIRLESVDHRDQCESLLSRLNPRLAEMVRGYHMEDRRLIDVAGRYSREHACRIIGEAIKQLRDAA